MYGMLHSYVNISPDVSKSVAENQLNPNIPLPSN